MAAEVTTPSIHDEVLALIDNLPESVTWDDILDAVYLRTVVERGFRDIAAGRFVTDEEI